VVIKFNKHGALVSIKQGVAGLVHNSSFGTEEKLRSTLELGRITISKLHCLNLKTKE
jgi:ribosomal protein S1